MGNLIQNSDFEQGTIRWIWSNAVLVTGRSANAAKCGASGKTYPSGPGAGGGVGQSLNIADIYPLSDYYAFFRFKLEDDFSFWHPKAPVIIGSPMGRLNSGSFVRYVDGTWEGEPKYSFQFIYEYDLGSNWHEALLKFTTPGAIDASLRFNLGTGYYWDEVSDEYVNMVTFDDVYLDRNPPSGNGGDLTALFVLGGLVFAGAVAYYLWGKKKK